MTELSAPDPALDVVAIARALNDHGVSYVIVGGIAAIAHGYSGATFDADVVPGIARANLANLVRALASLEAQSLAASGEVLEIETPPPSLSASTIRDRLTWHFATSAGRLDVMLVIDGVGGYRELQRRAEQRTPDGVTMLIADLDDIIESKEAVGRPKDLRALDELRRLQRHRNRERNR